MFNFFKNTNNRSYDDPRETPRIRKSFVKGSILILTILILFPTMFSLFTEPVRPGYAGVLLSWNGGIKERVLDPGRNAVLPWESVKEYPVSTETVVYDIAINNKDGKPIVVKVSINYSMNRNMLPHIYTRFRGQSADAIENTFMKTNILGALNNISSKYSMMQIVNERQQINVQLLPALQNIFRDDGIDITEAQIIDAPPDPETAKVLQAVINAQNYEKQMQHEKAAAIAQAAKDVEVARGKKQAKELEADGIAYYNKKVAESTDARVVELEYAKAFREKWDGKLPQYQLGSGGNMFNLGNK